MAAAPPGAPLGAWGGAQLALANALLQGLAGLARVHAELFPQLVAKALVLRQGGGALAIARQQAHQALLAAFLPGVELHQALGMGQSALQLALLFEVIAQVFQQRQGVAAQRFALQQQPVFEVRTVGQVEAGEEVAAVQRGGFGQFGDAVRALLAGRAGAAVLRRLAEAQHVDVSGGQEAQAVLAGLEQCQAGRCLQYPAQVGQSAPQVAAPGARRAGFPEQGGERLAAVFALVLQAQVGEQRAHLVVVEAVQWLIAPGDGEAAEQVQAQRRGGGDSVHVGLPGLGGAGSVASGADPVRLCGMLALSFTLAGSAVTAAPFCHPCRAAATPAPSVHPATGKSSMQQRFARHRGGRPCR